MSDLPERICTAVRADARVIDNTENRYVEYRTIQFPVGFSKRIESLIDQNESRYEWLEKIARVAENLPRPSPSEVRDLDGFRFHAYRQIDRDGREYMTWVLAAPSGWGTGVEFGRWKV